MHPITILILTFLSVSQNFVVSQTEPASPYWLSDGSSVIKSQNNSFSSDPSTGDFEGLPYGVMWIDGDGLNKGEHLWTITLRGENNRAHVGLSNKEMLGRGYLCGGIYYDYDGNLITCNGRPLFKNFGPGIHNDTVIQLLISFAESKDRLKIYYNQDGLPLGPAFDIPDYAIPNLYPVVRFTGVGSATIYKENRFSDGIPRDLFPREKDKKIYEGINGLWKLDVQNPFIEGISKRQDPRKPRKPVPQSILEIKSDEVFWDRLNISLKVVKRLEFNATRTNNSWISPNLGLKPKVSIFEAPPLEEFLDYMVRNPETISINSKGQLEMDDEVEVETFKKVKEVRIKIKWIWDRYEYPNHFVGDPFRLNQ